MYDVAVIGTGIIGTFIARELSKYQLKILMIDKENDIANGTTMANSAIIHAGYDAKADKNKGKFNAPGNKMYEKLCDELDVPFKKIGSLVIGFDEEDQNTIKELYKNGLENDVEGMEILNKEQVLEMEPNLNDTVTGALYAPSAGIISPFEMAIALAENAMDNGAELILNSEVTDIKKVDNGYMLEIGDRKVEAQYVINCAGVYADHINNMVASSSFEIKPRKGHYFILDKSVGSLVNHVIFQCPSDKGKGILVAPTVHGNILIGPDSEFIDDKENLGTTAERLDFIRTMALKTTTQIPYHTIIRSFTGLRATADIGDFIIEESKEAKGFINVGGIESPGLSAAPAIAEYVVNLLKEISGGMEENENFIATRKKFIRFNELTDEEKAEVIKEDPRYGRVICRCETVTEGEIVDSIHRNAGATTVKGVKKRTRSGMGRCQGGFCSPKVVEILARELGEEMININLDSLDSYILTGKTKENDLYKQ
ncbi:NAD(P)/FAD-dependent oxidoreductase [Vallitalea okinawensis]|uniref:NAD(P)/FAD-dependent oxidoreductase n=1 Tax=Vallitalea okinawensis TaxID=2078660 RepID=UPI000CFAA6DA|nr:NAD(P)/FAD-dependent oxidoreductase [Vallitalea okinawensis]